MLRVIFIVLFTILNCSNVCYAIPGTVCKVPRADAGTCMLLSQCRPLKELSTKKDRTQEEQMFFTQSIGLCGYTDSNLEVCCPPRAHWSKLTASPVLYPEPNVYQTDSGFKNVIANILTRNGDSGNETVSYRATFDFGDDEEQINEICGTDVSRSRKIVGGEDAEIEEYPWLALLEYEPNEFKCGGSLISTRHVLTAAHCFISSLPKQVILSEYNISSAPVDWVVRDGRMENITITNVSVDWAMSHPGYRPLSSLYRNDIGLVKMSYPVQFTDYIRPICLPTMDYSIYFTNLTKFMVAGWGSDNERQLTDVKRAVSLPYVSADDCHNPLPENQYICAGGEEGKDTCTGDSGGPLMYEDNKWKSKYIIVGVVSSGFRYCGTEGYPGFYTSVYKHLSWIHDMMKD
ncbi:phenoloxidase-activating enzyme-like [Epargyreus clarus]|uniref:phenoloxidase-activating enzyme-like n=1 Tax=Epargyreus clarus TaxID=520877 RepID=UPI003C2B79B7